MAVPLCAVSLVIGGCTGGSNPASPSTTSAPTATTAPTDSPSPTPGEVVRVGFVSSRTGARTQVAQAERFVIDKVVSYVDAHPIETGSGSYTLKVLVRDAQSSPSGAARAAADLITQDGADVVLAEGPSDIVNSVADTCERLETPCLTGGGLWQDYWFGRQADPARPRPFAWTYHFGWGLEDVVATFSDMWSQVDTSKKVSLLAPNDQIGRMWSANAPDMVKVAGYSVDSAGLFAPGTSILTAQVAAARKAGDEIVAGVASPSDFATYWTFVKQLSYGPKVVTISGALAYPDAIAGLGAAAEGLGTEVWWSPAWPYSSSLTGQSSADLGAAFESETGRQWIQSLGYAQALFDVLGAAVVTAQGSDPAALAAAMRLVNAVTIVGPINFASGPVPNVGRAPISGGQWVASDGARFAYELKIASNVLDADIPVERRMEPLAQ